MFLGIVGVIIGGVFLLLVIVLVIAMISGYNKLVVARNKVKNAWSQIDVQLKRRFDLIPNLVETVKGYAKHEEAIYGEFAKARGLYQSASQKGDVKGMAEAEKGLSGALSRLLVVTEQYPQLQANENFKSLMNDLKDTENKISYTRQFYNDIVMTYNNMVERFPGLIVARFFGFKPADFFAVTDEAQREAPKVQF